MAKYKEQIQGKLKQESWSDNQGQKRSKHSILVESMQMLDARQQDGNDTQPSKPPVTYVDTQGNEHSMPDFDVNDDEIPF